MSVCQCWGLCNGRRGCSALAVPFGLLAHPCLCSGGVQAGWHELALMVEVPLILYKNGVPGAQKAVKTAFCVNKKKKITIKINVRVIFVSLPIIRRAMVTASVRLVNLLIIKDVPTRSLPVSLRRRMATP